MPSLESVLKLATAAVVFFLLVSAAAFFALGPGFSWFSLPPAPSPTKAPSPSPSPESTPFPVPQASGQPDSGNASNLTQMNVTANQSNSSASPSPVQQIEVSAKASAPRPPTKFGMPFTRSSFPISLRALFPAALAIRFGDLDSDGNLDLVVFEGALRVSAYLSNGHRIWSWDNPPYEGLAGKRQAPGVVYDLNRDGRPEVAFVKAEAEKRFLVLVDGANGVEEARAQLPVENTSSLALAVGDFSKSGWKDSLVVLARNSSVQELVFYDSSLNRLREYISSKPLGYSVSALDVDGDGREEAVASGIAVDFNGSVRWKHQGEYSNSEAEEISLVNLQGDLGKGIAFSYGKDGMLVSDGQGKEVWATSVSQAVHASKTVSPASSSSSASGLAVVVETRNPLEQGLSVFSPGGGKLWGIDKQPVNFASRPFECSFGGPASLFYAGKFYDSLQGNSSIEEFGRGIACADLSGDGREELVSLRQEAGGDYLDVYGNPVAAQPPVAKRNSDLAYLLEKGTLPATRG